MHPVSARPSLDVVRKLLEAADLPTTDLTAGHCDHFFFAGDAARPSGIVGLEIFGDVALLRSLVVAAQQRGTGVGTALLARVEQYAQGRGIRALYLLTTTAESFFARQGYSRVERGEAPPAIQASREFADLCPASCAFMAKSVRPAP
jgi:amino-acid N-acetyltransferase